MNIYNKIEKISKKIDIKAIFLLKFGSLDTIMHRLVGALLELKIGAKLDTISEFFF